MLQEYKDAGLEVYMPGTAVTFSVWGASNGATLWAESNAKRVFDLCEQVGLKVLLMEDWLLKITNANEYTDEKFETTWGDHDKLVARIKNDMAPYVNHPAFYGVMLTDEPKVEMAERYGKVYKAIKEAYPEVRVYYNLLPGEDNSYYEAFINAMEPEYLTFDQYPLYGNKRIYAKYISDLQRIAALCAANGVDLEVVTQATKKTNGTAWRSLDEADLYWLNNMLAGFGVKNIYYYTYYTKPDSDTETYEDGYAFIDNDGNPTATYTSLQKIMAEMQLLAPVILEYDYNSSAVYEGAEGYGGFYGHSHYEDFVDGTLAKIQSVSVDNERALITELKNADGEYMYMIQNVADPDCSCSYNKAQTTTVTFTADVTSITVYTNGVAEEITLTGNTYTVTQTAGQAVYIVL